MKSERRFYVYLAFDEVGTLRYVGKGNGTRWYRRGKTDQLRIKALFENPLCWKEIYQDGLTEIEAFQLERQLIRRFGREDLDLGPLWNLTDGGLRNTRPGPLTLVKMRLAATGKKQSPEILEKKRLKALGKRHTEETKQKLRVPKTEEQKAKLRGRPFSEDHRRNLGLSHLGKKLGPQSEEHKRKIGLTRIGKPTIQNRISITNGIQARYIEQNERIPSGWFLGKTFETRRKQKEAALRRKLRGAP